MMTNTNTLDLLAAGAFALVALVACTSIALKGQTTMTNPNTFIVREISNGTLGSDLMVFTNIGSALDYARDSHEDLNPEGTVLGLEVSGGIVPATNKAVKSAQSSRLVLRAMAAEAGDLLAAAQSKLDGALAACALMDIDPGQVAKVSELREAVADAANAMDSEASVGTVEFLLTTHTAHKRTYKPRA